MEHWSPLQVAVAARDWELVRYAARGSSHIAVRSVAPSTPTLSELLRRPPHLYSAATAVTKGAHPLGGKEVADSSDGERLVCAIEMRYGQSNHELQPHKVRQYIWLLLCVSGRVAASCEEARQATAGRQARHAAESAGPQGEGGALARRPSWRLRLSSVSTWVRRRRPPVMSAAPIFDVWCYVFDALRDEFERRALEELNGFGESEA
jgi:hypothetical protein